MSFAYCCSYHGSTAVYVFFTILILSVGNPSIHITCSFQELLDVECYNSGMPISMRSLEYYTNQRVGGRKGGGELAR